MGHFHTEVTAVGHNRKEAERIAIDNFFYENGHRHSLYEVESAEFVEKVPPQKEKRETQRVRDWFGKLHETTYITMEPDPDAPPEAWLEKWKFVLHTHA